MLETSYLCELLVGVLHTQERLGRLDTDDRSFNVKLAQLLFLGTVSLLKWHAMVPVRRTHHHHNQQCVATLFTISVLH